MQIPDSTDESVATFGDTASEPDCEARSRRMAGPDNRFPCLAVTWHRTSHQPTPLSIVRGRGRSS